MHLAFFRRTRRAFGASLAAVFSAVALLVCMPVPAAANPGHCAPQSAASDAHHPCDLPSSAMDCCVEAPRTPAVPSAPQDAVRIDAASVLAVAHAVLVSQQAVRASAASLRAAPVHGHRHIDLPTLNAAFLI